VGVEREQVISYYLLQKFIRITKKHGITTWVFAGTLLGAIRNQMFAGRPGDLDFFVRDDDVREVVQILEHELFRKSDLIRKLPLINRTFRIDSQVNLETKTHYVKFYFLGKSLQLFEIASLTPIVRDGTRFFEFNSIMYPNVRDKLPTQEFEALRKSWIHGVQVNVLKNSEEYLELHYGSDWMTPKPGYKSLRV
jgi:phosphorylcholine metabolism protein LicD